MKRILILMLAAVLTACTTTQKIVTVPEVHEVHHHHTDSILVHDSTYHERETVIRQVDSSAMAAYGIQMKEHERAWLIMTSQLRQELQRVAQIKTDTVRDTLRIPYPVEVPKEQKPTPSAWQQFRMHLGTVCIIVLVLALLIFAWRTK